MLTEKEIEVEILKIAREKTEFRQGLLDLLAGKIPGETVGIPHKRAKSFLREASSEEVFFKKEVIKLALEMPEHRAELLSLFKNS